VGATTLTHLLSGRSASGGVLAARRDDRVLVVIEMAGGNDGFSMVVPYSDSAYRRLRPSTAVPAEKVLRLSNQVGLHPQLGRLHRRGVAVVQGVGVPNPDLSHFEMLRRLWAGNFDGTTLEQTGFLGRLCDVIGDEKAAAVGISLGTGPSPVLASERTVTASLDPSSTGFPLPDDDDLKAVWRVGFEAMSQPDRADTVQMLAARRGAGGALRLAQLLENLGPEGDAYPADNDLAVQLRFAARVIAARVGVRVIHVPMNGDFDTHENHVPRVATNMGTLDAAVDAFLVDLEKRGLGGAVLVMTVSEFGRRAAENGNPSDAGLDHGAASSMLMAGAVKPGVYGESPLFHKLDDDGNPRFTTRYEDYLATAVEGWFGVPAGDVLRGSAKPIGGIV
jgi:uncharacterized protein (DUF1501 family)